ncbi:MAG: hypothetical protein KF905_11105 [Flavobacteriales bacterium]|nr:hypothetical protein [Flavobacteriales bacterium]
MQHRTLTLITACTLLAATLSAQAPRIVLQGSGSPQVFTDFVEALAAAQPNDRLYFSGGSFPYPANTTISMPLHFIGAGIHPDSTSVTDITSLQGLGSGPLIFTNGASNSTFTGIRFQPGSSIAYGVKYGTESSNDHPTGMLFQRCHFNGRVDLGNGINDGTYSQTTFDACIFKHEVNGYNGSAVMTRCILDHNPGAGGTINLFQNPGALTFENSVLLRGTITNSDNATVRNCIFTRPNSGPIHQSNNASISNCLFVSSDPSTNSSNLVLTNNTFSVTASQLFVNETNNEYDYVDDLHLVPSSPGVGGANDGTDIGIYGSSSPYKDGAMPFNPHYRQADIAPSTNANGELPVNIRVAAQPN